MNLMKRDAQPLHYIIWSYVFAHKIDIILRHMGLRVSKWVVVSQNWNIASHKALKFSSTVGLWIQNCTNPAGEKTSREFLRVLTFYKKLN